MQLSMYSCISRGPSECSAGERYHNKTTFFWNLSLHIPKEMNPWWWTTPLSMTATAWWFFLHWLCEQITSHKIVRGSTVKHCRNRESWPDEFYSSHVSRSPYKTVKGSTVKRCRNGEREKEKKTLPVLHLAGLVLDALVRIVVEQVDQLVLTCTDYVVQTHSVAPHQECFQQQHCSLKVQANSMTAQQSHDSADHMATYNIRLVLWSCEWLHDRTGAAQLQELVTGQHSGHMTALVTWSFIT